MDKKLGFGFMRLPLIDKNDQTSFDYEHVNKMVDIFMENGFCYFDTALTYHGSKSEEAIRKAVVERYPRESFKIATKLPPRVLRSSEDQERIFNIQLKKCGVDYFDYVRAIKKNPIAVKVKLADLAHNSDASRFAGVEVPKDRIGYFRDKYTKAKAILLEE